MYISICADCCADCPVPLLLDVYHGGKTCGRDLRSEFMFGNFAESLKTGAFDVYYKNSLIVTSVATIITISINLLAGFAFAKYDFKGKNICFLIVLSTLMIPLQVTMVPNFIIASKLGIRNSYVGLILPPCAEAFGLFMARQFIEEIPNELLEAGRIDGATEFGIFSKIVLPNVKPLISVQLGLSMLNGSQYVNWNDLMSASLISTIPIVIVFLIFQKQFVQGMASSGIKG